MLYIRRFEVTVLADEKFTEVVEMYAITNSYSPGTGPNINFQDKAGVYDGASWNVKRWFRRHVGVTRALLQIFNLDRFRCVPADVIKHCNPEDGSRVMSG